MNLNLPDLHLIYNMIYFNYKITYNTNVFTCLIIAVHLILT